MLFTRLIYAPGQKVRYPGNRTAEDTVTSFYMAIDSGDYERAYELVLEPRWTGVQEPATYREAVEEDPVLFKTWTTEEEFLQRMKSEVGAGGSGITLKGVDARILEPVETVTYEDIYGISDVRGAYRVEASGNILGACSIFTWRKELVVLQIGKGYRVLLSGTKDKNSYYYQSWFTGFERVGNLRAAQTQSVQPVQYGYGKAGTAENREIPSGCGCR